MTRADSRKDKIYYDGLRADFGEASPKASGYLSEYSFFQERALVLDAVGDEPGTILDLACGGGLVSLPLAAAGERVIGLDFNKAACQQAKRNGIDAIRGNAFSLPLADGIADVVLNVEVAQEYELKALGSLLHEVARVLRPGGRLIIVWGNRRALVHRIAHPVSQVLDRLRGRGVFRVVATTSFAGRYANPGRTGRPRNRADVCDLPAVASAPAPGQRAVGQADRVELSGHLSQAVVSHDDGAAVQQRR